MSYPCSICGRPVSASRPPSLGRVFAHGPCMGADVLIVEYRVGVDEVWYDIPPEVSDS